MSELTPQSLEDFRTALELLQRELKDQLQEPGAGSQPVALDQQLIGRVSRIDAIQQQEVARAGLQHAREQFRLVRQALARLESGDFGYCLRCDGHISEARLKAQPQVPLCLDCQSAAER